MLKNDSPCFYLKDAAKTAETHSEYFFRITNLTTMTHGHAHDIASHLGDMPTPKSAESCFSFPQDFKYQLNDIYSVYNFRYDTYSNFCLIINDAGVLQINQVIQVDQGSKSVCSDMAYDNNKGFEHKFKQLFF